MLNEYISLKEQKVMLEQERARLDQEKSRVQTLLHGMQSAMNTYNASGSLPSLPPNMAADTTRSAVVAVPQPVQASTSGTILIQVIKSLCCKLYV